MTDPLPRLAVALREVGDRIHQISAELTTLQTAPLPGSRPGWQNVAPAPGTRAPDQTAPRAGWTEAMAAPRPATGEPAEPRTATPEAGVKPAGPQPGWWPAPNPGPIPSWPTLPPPQPPKPRLWEREGAGSRLLAWVGGIVTLAGVVLLLVLAIQRGYLGPLPRVLLGAGLGLALIGIGMWLRPSPAARTGAYALAATGFGVLYLDVIAATTLFEFFLPAVGLGVGLAVAAFGLGLAARWDTQGFATFVVVSCAVCAPFLAEGALLLGFLLVLEICATPVQLAKRWGRLCVAAGIPPVLAVIATIPLAGSDGPIVAYLALVTSAVQ
ncbi:MAG TPA: DUF2339 domain-containing protein, partial [Actinophytocola sp.]|nr:DUF2339 domain-containing protein [Actinophytocola sp.]